MDDSTLETCPTCGGTCVKDSETYQSLMDEASAERIRLLEEQLLDLCVSLSCQRAYAVWLKRRAAQLNRQIDELRRSEGGARA